MLEAYNAVAVSEDVFHDIFVVVGHARELVAGLGVVVAIEAHLD